MTEWYKSKIAKRRKRGKRCKEGGNLKIGKKWKKELKLIEKEGY